MGYESVTLDLLLEFVDVRVYERLLSCCVAL